MSAGLVVLLVSEDPAARANLARMLEGAGHDVVGAASAAEAEAALGGGAADVALASLERPGIDGPDLLHVLQERVPELPVLLVAEASSAGAAEFLRHGGHGTAPREPDGLLAAVARAGELHRLRREVERLRRETSGPRTRVALLGRSEPMREMGRQVDELAARSSPVLITGAAGTGKNVVARELHERSPRASAPFVGVSCRGMAETLLESQLFGHRRGAFPGAVQDHPGAVRTAAGGTLFVDRIETMPLPLQARLVAALQAGRVAPLGGTQPHELDVRLVAAASRDLEPMVRAGTFRDDLSQKVGPTVLRLPPLRERREDIPFLAEAFVAEAAERFGVAARRFDTQAHDALLAYAWPGNVRELREAIEHAFARGLGEVVRYEHLPPHVRAGARAGLGRDPERRPTLGESEAELVALVLEESGGNKTEAARRLGIDRKRLYRKIKRYSLLGSEGDDDDET